jgi:hypothetical protein
MVIQLRAYFVFLSYHLVQLSNLVVQIPCRKTSDNLTQARQEILQDRKPVLQELYSLGSLVSRLLLLKIFVHSCAGGKCGSLGVAKLHTHVIGTIIDANVAIT